MTQLAIDIPKVTVRVLKAQRTLAGDAVKADRIDGVASGDMPRLLVLWREEGEDVSGGSSPPSFAMELTLVVQALMEPAARADAVRDLDTMILQCPLALLEVPASNRRAAAGGSKLMDVIASAPDAAQSDSRPDDAHGSGFGWRNSLARCQPGEPFTAAFVRHNAAGRVFGFGFGIKTPQPPRRAAGFSHAHLPAALSHGPIRGGLAARHTARQGDCIWTGSRLAAYPVGIAARRKESKVSTQILQIEASATDFTERKRLHTMNTARTLEIIFCKICG